MTDPRLDSLCAAVSGSVMQGHLTEFAHWVKLSGTADELRSLDHVRARMAEYGYRTELIMHDAYISLPGKARVEGLPGGLEVVEFHGCRCPVRDGDQNSSRMRCLRRESLVETLLSLMPSTSAISRWLRSSR